MSLLIPTSKQFLDQMIAYFIANQDKITDVNSGSAIYTQFQAMAIQLNQALVKASGGFKVQFQSIPFDAFDFQRKAGNKASATVVFSAQNPVTTQIDIPIGTVVGTSGGLLYTTQNAVSILVGNTDSGAANVIAEKIGTEYNVQTGVINVINSNIEGVNAVTNNTAATGGQDKETNSSYFARFSNFILGLSGSNRYGIFTASTSVDGILSAFIEDHFPPELDLYNFTAYVDDGSGNVPQSKLDEVYLEIYGNDTAEYPGWAAAGINFRVLSAGLVPVAVVYEVKIDPVSSTATQIESLIEAAINNYINSLWVGVDVIRSEIIRLIKGINGVIDVTTLTLNGVADNITTLPSQVARVSTIGATITT